MLCLTQTTCSVCVQCYSTTTLEPRAPSMAHLMAFLSVCQCACVCFRRRGCVRGCARIHVCVSGVCVCVCMSLCVWCVCVCLSVCVCVYMCVCVCVCVF